MKTKTNQVTRISSPLLSAKDREYLATWDDLGFDQDDDTIEVLRDNVGNPVAYALYNINGDTLLLDTIEMQQDSDPIDQIHKLMHTFHTEFAVSTIILECPYPPEILKEALRLIGYRNRRYNGKMCLTLEVPKDHTYDLVTPVFNEQFLDMIRWVCQEDPDVNTPRLTRLSTSNVQGELEIYCNAEGKAVGYLMYMETEGEPEEIDAKPGGRRGVAIDHICVKKSERGRGIAGELLRRVTNRLNPDYVSVAPSSEKALKYFLANGYEYTGHRVYEGLDELDNRQILAMDLKK